MFAQHLHPFGTLSQSVYHLEGVRKSPADDQPSRGFGKEAHADEHADGGNDGRGNHESPVSGGVAQREVHEPGGDHAEAEHEFVGDDDGAAALGGGHLGDVGGDDDGGCAYAQAHDESAEGERDGARGGRHDERTEEEKDAVPRDGAAATDVVHQRAADERAEHGAELGHADDHLLGRLAEVQARLHVHQRARDEPEVVSEEKSAESGEGGDEEQHGARVETTRDAPARARRSGARPSVSSLAHQGA